MLEPSPAARWLCAVGIIVAVIFTRDLRILIAVFGVAAMTCLYVHQVRGLFIKFLLWVWLPLVAWGITVWGGIVGSPPGFPLHSDAAGGVLYAFRISVRLGAAVSVLQAFLLSVDLEDLARGLFSLRVPRGIVLVVLSVVALGPELRKRSEQVLTARAARGLLNRGGRLRAGREAANTLVPLVTWGFRSAAMRFEYWNQRGLLESPWLDEGAPFRMIDAAYVTFSAVWCVAALWAYGNPH
jgi:energy-coupling factor transporter transmembrane protein EcfT